ncbi:hypothetical protein EJ02DRAFT_231936 [Clathrospora elynae]|uniref:Uncharacterized protein n=1 Tax=Clathrospora elynae TaxID=706981 RepID=A0A6A5SI37_9PLEO|nr:hypothetical protein EJ02DRAFT_231936 [Clathrospora elynae]
MMNRVTRVKSFACPGDSGGIMLAPLHKCQFLGQCRHQDRDKLFVRSHRNPRCPAIRALGPSGEQTCRRICTAKLDLHQRHGGLSTGDLEDPMNDLPTDALSECKRAHLKRAMCFSDAWCCQMLVGQRCIIVAPHSCLPPSTLEEAATSVFM